SCSFTRRRIPRASSTCSWSSALVTLPSGWSSLTSPFKLIAFTLSMAMGAGTLLREARMRAGLGQRELARRAGIPQPTLSRIERGLASPRFDTLDRLLRECGLALDLVRR